MRIFNKLITLILFISVSQRAIQAQTTLAPGDIAFSGYIGAPTVAGTDEFSFVLLAPVTNGTVINFTDNGWLSTNTFRTGEQTIVWTASGAIPAGTEIKIVGTTATTSCGAPAGNVTGTPLSFSLNGDQVLAYQGTAASPTFISAIHTNVYLTSIGDPTTTNATVWDGAANTTNASALPTGLTTGVNCIWIGTQNVQASEFDNSRFTGCGLTLNTVAAARTALNNQANWTSTDGDPAGFTLPTGCSYIGQSCSPPVINTNPTAASICAGANTSFSITATGALTYQWQVDNGGGFANITNDAIYTGATTTTLNITATPGSFNTYQYRCVATNGAGPTNSTAAILTVNSLPAGPTLLAKTPNTATVADGTPVSATFNAGSGGTGCADDFRYTTNGGVSYLPYTPGSNISTTGLAAGGGTVTIEGRRANCSAGCQGNYVALATWIVTPLPGAATTLNAGDIGFTSYAAANDEFSFVLLRNIGPGTVINFTNNGWLSTNVFRTGEETVSWTSNAAYAAGTEVKIAGTTATLAAGGSAGTVTGTALSLSLNGDQILAYRGSTASPTFISAIHMNVYTTLAGDPAPSTTAAAWDGTANTQNSSALPTGLTTGVNAIWVGTQDVTLSEFDNSRFGNCGNPATLGPIATLRAALNNQSNWTSNNNSPTPGFAIPTGCNYLGVAALPNITTPPASSSICSGAIATFSVVATGATGYQWQVDNGGGFANITNDATYSGATTTTLTITNTPIGFTGYQYRCVVSNGSGSVNSNAAILTVTALPVNPTLATKTPGAVSVADGTNVSATFNAGSGGTGCSDDYRYTTDGGVTYLPYTPGANITTTGLAAGSGYVFIEGRRANCSAGCQGDYVVLASWYVTPLPVAATTLNAGDIGFSSYAATTDEFSFVLLKNIGPGTVINFTNNGWLSTNVFRTGEETVTWTAPAGGMPAGTEIKIAGLTATRSGGGAAGIVTGTAISLSLNGDQVLAYRGTVATPTFISAIHMNVYTTLVGDPAPSTTAAAWDGTANTQNSSALPTGLTTGTNAIWIGTQDVSTSEFDNAAYGNCLAPGVLGPIAGLRAALNNQANWIRNNNAVPGFVIPTCNYFGLAAPSISILGTPLNAFTSCAGTASAEQNFTVSGSSLTTAIVITAPTNFEVSTTSGTGFSSSVTLPQSGGTVAVTTIYVRMAASATGNPSGNITIATSGVTTINVAVSGTVSTAPTTANAGSDDAICGLTYTLAGNTPSNGTGAWTQVTGPGTTTFGDATQGNSSITVTAQGIYTYRWAITSTGCPPSEDTVAINFRETPPVANAGADRTLCLPSSNLNMAGNAPAPGTGTWTQISGPVAAAFGNPFNSTTSVSGLNTIGVYTFVWTITNAPCLATTDTMTVTVSAAPPFFDVRGDYACQGTTVNLTGAIDPNYTYAWGRSLSGINGTYISLGVNTQILPVTVSGNYQLITTNQFGCSMVDTAVVHVGDYQYAGTLATGDAQLTNRINRFGQVSTCAAPKACPGVFSGPGARLFDSYQIINKRSVPVCATIGLASGCGTSIFNVAYLKSFDPTNPCTNYLGDPGSSFPSSGFMEVTIPANDTILIVVHEVNGGTGCSNYFLSVDVPRDPAAIGVSPSPPFCSGSPITLTGAVADTYLWTPGGANTQAIIVNPAATTQYNVTYGYGNIGCNRQDSVNLIIGSTVTTAFAGNDTATCGNTITLAANTPVTGTGIWSQVSGPGTITFGSANSPNSTATASVNGTYKLYWTITAGLPCPGNSIDSVLVNFDAQPTANAGPDLTVCTSPGSRTLSAVSPTVGIGSWQFVSGPATANIFPPVTNPNAGVTGMTVPGTYTFVWTVTNGVCAVARDTMVVVANPIPPTPTVTGGGVIVCQGSTVTLTGPADPNYTYLWERSLGSNGAAFSTVGTGQTLNTTVSGVFRLTVTNQFGCSATSGQSIVHIADYVFNGSIGAGDLQQTGRINRFGQVSTCAVPKTCPGIFIASGARFYDSYQIINRQNVPVCATIGTNNPCSTNIFTVAYLKTFNPSSTCTNYLADPGSSFTQGGFMEVTIPANDTIIVVVHEVNTGQGCTSYGLTVNVPRDMSAIVVNPPTVTCASTATLTAPVADTYLWTPGGATTQAITTAALFVDTKYNVTLGYGNNGCTRADSVTVVVTSLPPTVSCPTNISLNNTTGLCGRTVTYTTTVGGTPTPTLTYAFTGATTGSGSGNGSGSFFNVGVTNVTVTATNSCGSVNCSFTVNITDNEAPTVTTGTIASCYPTVAAAQAAALAATSATDNCPGALTETASTIGTCSAVVTVRTADVAGNFTDITYNTRIDNTAPTVTVGTIGSCYPTAAAAEAAALAATSATDNCPGALTEVASTVGTCSAVITVTTTDGCGNATAVTYNTRIDNTAPTVTVGTIGSCYPTAAAAEAAALAATSATDNCPGALTEVASAVGTCSAVITVTTTDGCGNATSVTYNTRIDNTPPTLTCPAPVTVSCVSQVPVVDINTVTGVTDNCPGAITVTHQGDVIGGQTCTNRYTITRTYRATDGCGNFTECTQIITVNDQTAPTMTCPANFEVSCPADIPAANINDVTGISDNCGGVITVTHQGDVITNQTCASRYQLNRTYRATDVCGNFTECTQIITVNDQTAPVLTCPANTTVSCVAEVPAPNPASVTGVSDNCGGPVTVTHQGDVINNQSCVNRYSITRTYRATDACGNFSECTQIITVNDQTAPSMTCPAPITVSCPADVPAPNPASVTGLNDNCGGVVTVTHVGDVISNQTCANRYTLIRTYRATDVCGNFTECTQIITVNDLIAPTISCPVAITVTCSGDVPVPNPSSITASDNCVGTVTVTHISDVTSNQTCLNRYVITRTYRATDACGNFTNCTQTITVNDNVAPSLTCPGPITVTCAANIPAPNTSLITGVSDNCTGPITITFISDVVSNQTCANKATITRTYRATDDCGNFTNCTQIIRVNDSIPPTMTCPAPITVTCTGLIPLPNPGSVVVSDNCGGPVSVVFVSDVISNQSCSNKYIITRTYRATDNCNNSSTCTQIITVNDNVGPAISCPASITLNTALNVCTAVANYSVTATDNCGGGVTITSSHPSGSSFPIGTTTVTIRATDNCGNISTCTFTVTVLDSQIPVISTPPANQVVCLGNTAIFNVVASATRGFQWQVQDGAVWLNIPSATGPTLVLNNVSQAQHNARYRVIINGVCSNIISNFVTLTVNGLPSLSLTAAPKVSLLPTETTTITATANPTGGTYAWFFNNAPLPVTGTQYGPITVDGIGNYKVDYTDLNGCKTSAGISIIGTPSIRMWTYPNPSRGRFQIRFYNQNNEVARVSIYDALGQRVFTARVPTGVTYSRIDVNLGGAPNGIYTVQLISQAEAVIGSAQVVINH